MTMRPLFSSLALASILLGASPGFGADASVPDGATGGKVDAGSSHRDASAVSTDATVKPTDATVKPTDAASSESAAPAADSRPPIAVGKACAKDSQCPTGLSCLLATSNDLGAGGPAKGLCTLDCKAGGQATCDAIDPGSICRSDSSGAVAHCFERCIVGNTVDAQKCHKRPDMACAPTPDTGEGFCAPTCRGDLDCEGRKCDPVSGLCVDSVPGTLPIGAACDPPEGEAGTLPKNAPRCMGACLSAGDPPTRANSACSAVCTLGVLGACGEDPTLSQNLRATCVPLYPGTGEAEGDIGFCEQLCDCDGDCGNSAFVCQPVDITQGNVGRPGICVLGTISAGNPCPSGRLDAGPRPGSGGASGSATDSGTGGSGSPAAKKSDDSGCGCRVAGERSPSRGSALGALLVGLFAVLRRRARR